MILTNIISICSEEIRIKQTISYIHVYHSAEFKDSLKQLIPCNGNIFGNKCYRCNAGSLYTSTKL